MQVCPHCGNPIKPEIGWDFSEWKITTEFGSMVLPSLLQARIFDLLWRKQGTMGITREKLIDIIYAEDVNGGPSAHSIGYLVSTMRKYLVNVGIFIKRGGKGHEGYNLLFMTPKQARECLKSRRIIIK